MCPFGMNAPILNMAMQLPVNYQTEFECLSDSLDALETGFQGISGLLAALATKAGLTPAEIANAKVWWNPHHQCSQINLGQSKNNKL